MASPEYSRSSQTSGRRRPLGALLIVVVLCLMAFLLGIFVGKQRDAVSGSIIKTSQVPRHAATTFVASKVAVAPLDTTDATRVEVSDVAVNAGVDKKQTAVPVQDDQQVADPITKLISSSEQSPLGSGINSAANLVKEPVADVVSDVKKVDAASSVTTAVALDTTAVVKFKSQPVLKKGGYVVQVGSFKLRSDAEKVQKKLQAKFTVTVKRVDLEAKGVWFRVLVGPVATNNDAATLKGKLHDQCRMVGFVKKITS